MKIGVISRSREEYVGETKFDVLKQTRNLNPVYNPLERPKEYTRALNAAKIQRIYAQPFVYALAGHTDSLWRMAFHPDRVSWLLSGSCDGEIKIWNVGIQKTIMSFAAHTSSFVQGLAVHPNGNVFLSCGTDKAIKAWHYPDEDTSAVEETKYKPIKTWLSESSFYDLDIRNDKNSNTFATSSSEIALYDYERSNPISTYTWGCDSIRALKFNPVQKDVIVSAGYDRSLVLYDTRVSTTDSGSTVKKLILARNTNSLSWNPQEPFYFVAANDDSNLYTFDMRRLKESLYIHRDHIEAVMSVEYSPTGKYFVSGSFDKTVRIWNSHPDMSQNLAFTNSTEVYHTKRMQRVMSTIWSKDEKYVLSGSDEANIRVWKSVAWSPTSLLVRREKEKINYETKLTQRYKDLPEIKRIIRKRHLPKQVFAVKKLRKIQSQSKMRKERRVKAHTKKGRYKKTPDKQKNIVSIVN